MEGRTPTFAVTLPELTPQQAAEQLAERAIAAWWGDYYAVEVMNRLGLPHGALRIGLVHYNTATEVDRVLDALAGLT
jgi:selenocysteine lyase/cysteine desulfurase